MEERPEPTPEDLRIARRFALAMRVVVYGSLVALAVFVVERRRDASARAEPAHGRVVEWAAGRTSQGNLIYVHLDPGGRPDGVRTLPRQPCRWRRSTATAPKPLDEQFDVSAREGARLTWTGDRLALAWDRPSMPGSERGIRLSGELADGRFAGRLRARTTWYDADGRLITDCSSGDVGFSVPLP